MDYSISIITTQIQQKLGDFTGTRYFKFYIVDMMKESLNDFIKDTEIKLERNALVSILAKISIYDFPSNFIKLNRLGFGVNNNRLVYQSSDKRDDQGYAKINLGAVAPQTYDQDSLPFKKFRIYPTMETVEGDTDYFNLDYVRHAEDITATVESDMSSADFDEFTLDSNLDADIPSEWIPGFQKLVCSKVMGEDEVQGKWFNKYRKFVVDEVLSKRAYTTEKIAVGRR